MVLADLGQTCCAGNNDCPRTTAVTVVLNKRQTTSPVDAAPSTDHLRGSMVSLFWTMRREHGSRTMPWTYVWCVMAHARRRRLNTVVYSFYPRAIRIWNTIPKEISEIKQPESFQAAISKLPFTTPIHLKCL